MPPGLAPADGGQAMNGPTELHRGDLDAGNAEFSAALYALVKRYERRGIDRQDLALMCLGHASTTLMMLEDRAHVVALLEEVLAAVRLGQV